MEKGIGLTSIWERVRELGGTADYNSKKGEGFLLKVALPHKNNYVNVYGINCEEGN